MTFKRSHIALAFVASTTFCAMAETVAPGSVVTANANIAVVDDSKLALTIIPETNLTVADVDKGAVTRIARFKVNGKNAAVRFHSPMTYDPQCTGLHGSASSNAIFDVCMTGYGKKIIDANTGKEYFKYAPGEYSIMGTDNNKPGGYARTKPTFYTITMWAVQYTL